MTDPNYTFNGHAQHVHAATRRHEYLWRTRTEASGMLQGLVGKLAQATTPADEAPKAATRRTANTFARELYARVMSDAPALEQQQAATQWEQGLHRAVADAASTLHTSVGGDADFAALATAGLLAKAGDMLPSLLDQLEQEEAARQQPQGQPQGGEPGQPGDGPATGLLGGLQAGDLIGAAMRRLATQVAGELQETRTALAGLAPGLEAAPPSSDDGDPRRYALIEKVRDDKDVKRALQLAGRLHRSHARVRAMRTSEGNTEIVDVEQGGDMRRVLGTTRGKLDDADLGDYTLAQVLQRKALQYALAGTEPLERGPICVLRDVSGSMCTNGGLPHAWAAAACILAVQVGAKEKRAVTVVNYDGGVRTVRRLDAKGVAWTNGPHSPVGTLDSRMGGVADIVMAIASDATAGGTRLNPVITWALDNAGLDDERADLLLVTDGRADQVRADVLARVAAAKEAGLRISGLVINGGSLYRGVSDLCDSTVNLDRGDTCKGAADGILL